MPMRGFWAAYEYAHMKCPFFFCTSALCQFTSAGGVGVVAAVFFVFCFLSVSGVHLSSLVSGYGFWVFFERSVCPLLSCTALLVQCNVGIAQRVLALRNMRHEESQMLDMSTYRTTSKVIEAHNWTDLLSFGQSLPTGKTKLCITSAFFVNFLEEV